MCPSSPRMSSIPRTPPRTWSPCHLTREDWGRLELRQQLKMSLRLVTPCMTKNKRTRTRNPCHHRRIEGAHRQMEADHLLRLHSQVHFAWAGMGAHRIRHHCRSSPRSEGDNAVVWPCRPEYCNSEPPWRVFDEEWSKCCFRTLSWDNLTSCGTPMPPMLWRTFGSSSPKATWPYHSTFNKCTKCRPR